MPQFAVYRNPRLRSATHAPFLVEIQSDLALTQLRVVVPLVNPAYFGPPACHLNPLLRVHGESYVFSPAEIGSLTRKELGSAIADLRDARSEIMAALDFLLNGF